MPKRSRNRTGSEVRRRKEVARFDRLTWEQKQLASSPVEVESKATGKITRASIMKASMKVGVKKQILTDSIVYEQYFENDRFIVRPSNPT